MTRKNFYKVIFMTADELIFSLFHTCPTPSFSPLHKERTLNVCLQTFPKLQHSIGWEGGRPPKYFWRRCTVLWGNPELQLFYLLASQKTNKQKERWQGHRNSCGQLQRAHDILKTQRYNKHYFKQIDLNESGSSQS